MDSALTRWHSSKTVEGRKYGRGGRYAARISQRHRCLYSGTKPDVLNRFRSGESSRAGPDVFRPMSWALMLGRIHRRAGRNTADGSLSRSRGRHALHPGRRAGATLGLLHIPFFPSLKMNGRQRTSADARRSWQSVWPSGGIGHRQPVAASNLRDQRPRSSDEQFNRRYSHEMLEETSTAPRSRVLCRDHGNIDTQDFNDSYGMTPAIRIDHRAELCEVCQRKTRRPWRRGILLSSRCSAEDAEKRGES